MHSGGENRKSCFSARHADGEKNEMGLYVTECPVYLTSTQSLFEEKHKSGTSTHHCPATKLTFWSYDVGHLLAIAS